MPWQAGSRRRTSSAFRRRSAIRRSASTPDPGPPAITIRGAALHNLKHVDCDIPHGALTVCCGPSGSGKTSLVLEMEHNLEVIQAADWAIDMGPEAGAGGGKIVAEGPPEDIVIHAGRWRQQEARGGSGDLLRSHTGEALEAFLAGPSGGAAATQTSRPRARSSRPAKTRSRSY